MSIVELRDLRRSFGRREVLRGVTGSVRRGAVVGILGRNGEGKTTLMKVLLDLLAADSGEVEVLGMRPDGSSALRALIGYVPERPVFHSFMKAGEALELRERFFPRWSRDKARSLCRELDLDPATPLRGASKGTLAKLAWVCAAAHEPEVYLLDEPTSGLDALVREAVLSRLIADLHDSGRTVLVSNHRMEELAGVLDEVWVLSGGRIAAVHDMERLRAGALRVAGRLKPGARPPERLRALALPSEGPVAQWAAFDRAAVEELRGSGILEGMDCSPLAMEEAFRLLLAQHAGAGSPAGTGSRARAPAGDDGGAS